MTINDLYNDNDLIEYLEKQVNIIFIRFKLKSIIDFDDFLQNVNMKLIKSLKNYDESRSKITTFIYKITVNLAKDEIKLAHGQSENYNKLDIKNNTLSIDYYAIDSENDETTGFIKSDYNLENEVIESFTLDNLINESNLSEIQKKIINLFNEGYNKTEISDIIGMSWNSVQYHFKKIYDKTYGKSLY